MNWNAGRRVSRPANTSFFRPGRFGESTEMNQQQAPMATPSAGVPMAVYDSSPPPQRRSENAQLSSATPIQEDRPVQRTTAPPGPPPDGAQWDPVKGAFVTYNGSPTPPRYGGPSREKAPDFASLMQQKAMAGQLTMQDVLQARQMGEDGLAVAMMEALAGRGWNYTPTPRTPAPATPTPAATAPYMGAYDRGGAGPGMGSGVLEATMRQKAQAGTLTAADALIAEQAGDQRLASWIRNQVAGLGTPTTSRVAESQPGGGSRRYTTRIPGASKGIYTG